MHLAEKFGAFLPTRRSGGARNAWSWLFWPDGQRAFSRRWILATSTPTRRKKIEYAIDRYAMEVKRQLDVLNRRLKDNEYLSGGE